MVETRVLPMRIAAAVSMLAAAWNCGASERAPWTAVRADAIQAHVEFLADDLLEGRATASRGYDIAAAYVATQFRAAGLLPAGDEAPSEESADSSPPIAEEDSPQSGLKNVAQGSAKQPAGSAMQRSYYQTVRLLEATPVLPGSSAEFADSQTHTFEYGTDYLPSADYLAASSSLTAPLAFAGYGVAAPEHDHDDFAHTDVHGRIAVIFSGAPAGFPHNQRAYHSWSGRKLALLTEKGAVGAVVVDSPEDLRRVPWERRVAMSWVPQMRWLNEAGEPQDIYPDLKLRFRFSQAAAATLFARAERTFDEVLATAESGEPQGFTLPGMLSLSATTGLRRTQSRNVLAMLRGSDPALRSEFVVLTAHLDHLGRGPAVGGDSIYNGAHDNALGVAILLEMARAVHASGVRPRRSLLFAAVTAEEKGLLGSDYLARHPPTEAGALVANINVDMPMLFAPTQDFVGIGTQHSTLGPIASRASAAHGYRVTADLAPEEVAFIRSDQFSFVRQGIPSILLSGGNQARDASVDIAELKEEFRQTHYHQPSDDLALPMDFAAAADLARIKLRIALEVADSPAAPQWKPGDFFGEIFGRSAAPQ